MSEGHGVTVALVGDESLVAHCARLAASHSGVEVIGVATSNDDVARDVVAAGLAARPSSELASLVAGGVDVLFSIANERLLPAEVLGRARHAVNFHDGPLPELAGLAVTSWAIAEGAATHAVTWHRMTDDVDAGEVLLREDFPVAVDDTALSLNARCFEAGLATFPLVLERLIDDPPAGPGLAPARVVGRHERPLAWVDPAVPASEVARRVRALDVGGRVRNRVGTARWLVGDVVVFVRSARVVDGDSGTAPGTILSIDDDAVVLATVDGTLALGDLAIEGARPVTAVELADTVGFAVGSIVPAPPADLVAELAARDAALSAAETAELRALARVPDGLPEVLAGAVGGAPVASVERRLRVTPEVAVAAAVAWWSLATGQSTVSLAWVDPEVEAAVGALGPLLVPPTAEVVLDPSATVERVVASVERACSVAADRGPHLADLSLRDPRLVGTGGPTLLVRRDPTGSWDRPAGAALVVDLRIDAGDTVLTLTSSRCDVDALATLADRIVSVAGEVAARPQDLLAAIDLLDPDERGRLDAWNDTSVDHDRSLTIDGAVRAQAARTPGAVAVSDRATSLSYAELIQQVDVVAAALRSRGIGRGDLVGIALGRDVHLVVAVVAVLACGAAYVPLDPEYPATRLRDMADDAGLAAVLASLSVAARLGSSAEVVDPIEVLAAWSSGDGVDPVAPGHDASDAAYVIYTSGSTGAPKGVVIEHRQVVNFFVAMDDVIDHDEPGTWLAVTSLSFDISVLELLWTLTRGFHVVVHDRTVAAPTLGTAPRADRPLSPPTWSLFFFAAGEEQAADGYRLLLESARFADANDFEAVWVPERHFHAFGAAYPNPSVAGAAIAASTRRVGIRAGSVVLPLHATARVAEEWSVVDNLSGGRVGISFAAGWQARDFVLNPSAYATARSDLARRIAEVQALWRGDAVALPGHDGEPVEVVTLPRPVQPELPTWMTSAGSTATFEEAGRLGHNLLTHLLGQSVDQLASNVVAYRASRRAAGHEGDGHITLMLHTHLDRDERTAKLRSDRPMRGYLRTATGLIKDMASSFPTFAGAGGDADEAFRSLSDDEMEQLLAMAAERYMETSGLFTTPEGAADLVARLAEVGVDEVACLVDFGIDTDEVLTSLDLLVEARDLVDHRVATTVVDGPASAGEPQSIGAVAARHGATHLQCTPSLAEILLADPADRAALGTLRHLMVGGEALPESLAGELRRLVPGRLTNMYGPTETTIWSLVHEIDAVPDGPVPIGRPIANTTIHVLDDLGRRRRVGELGELHIGGEGVVRGYLHRPELTAERFVDRPGLGRLYATGDLARLGPDGVVEFAGRVDFQVKIRGHRIEMGEIEALLESDPSVERAVATVRGAGAEARLVAFVRPSGAGIDAEQLLDLARTNLPEVMVPDVVHPVDAFVLTPNGKIDRGALPVEVGPVTAQLEASERPADQVEERIAAVWSARLGHPIGRSANVFDAGGNSLLAVAVFRELQQDPGGLVLTDLFRHPTVAALAAHLAADRGPEAAPRDGTAAPPSFEAVAASGADRGARRRQARLGRGPARDGER